MMNNNKILTVSYGTFSCTLEGFEDSFDTMKAIAEYFRDLAADDRYFGAEPPQPDAEMLARIAEREVARRVEAREHDGRIMLKAHDEAVQPETPAVAAAAPLAVPAAAAVPDEEIVAPSETTAREVVAEEPDPEEMSDAATEVETPEAAAPEIAVDDAVEDENEEPVVVAEEETAAAPQVTPEEDTDATEEVMGEDAVTVEDADQDPQSLVAEGHEEGAEDETTLQDVFEEELQDQDAALSAEAFFADSPSYEDVQTETEAEGDVVEEMESFDMPADFAEPVDAPKVAAESIAAKLQRIRDVVSKQDDDALSDDYDEDAAELEAEPAVDFLDMPFDVATRQKDEPAEETSLADATLSDAAQEIGDALDADDQIAAEAEAEVEEEEDDLSSILSRIEAGTHDAEDAHDEDLLAADDDDAAEDVAENLFGDDDADTDPVPARESIDALSGDADVAEDPAPVYGRVLKVNRADLEAALDSGDLEEFDDENDDAALSAEEEADLQRELNAVTSDDVDDTDAKDTALDGLPAIDDGNDKDLSRLMAEADQQMEEPEGATRRSAFAHLRAAVAARFADKSMAREENEEETTKDYRSDLAEVVRPRRPVASGNRTERPADARPAPLKLVAEQRIDADSLRDNGPVMPRRVAATLDEDLDLGEDTGFAAFAEEMGATKLPDLLEAAAAYLSFVEGQEQFSRPQLMTRVRQAECGEFSREDGLRSFGQLLRSGKIEKIKGGRFTASEAIGFKPDERAAG
ncbi:hypothetical protein KX928_20870 [Roseobacter sp. YSTF-M11]|uniref:Lipoprotein n=1 Tax=Roseobacter insulae TaxID=2859783 RepID=A0A9X1K455_9RHOB|nr:hypothetical protein [Roseobacter insulae]MBW4710248.1 hypothetical protein [Roseobacter insulae]